MDERTKRFKNEHDKVKKRPMRRSALNKFIACLTGTVLSFVSVGSPLMEAYGRTGTNALARTLTGQVFWRSNFPTPPFFSGYVAGFFL